MISPHIKNALLEDLKNGRVLPDTFFDQIFPPEMKRVSTTHWTPIEVVKKAIDQISLSSNCSILDVGSGCGKFCIAGALIRSDIQFTGVELRADLVEASKLISNELELSNAHFINSSAFELNWAAFNILYFFNPFWENHLSSKQRIDKTIPIKKEDFDHYIKEVINRLEKLKKGTQVITYHGFGGKFPSSYECFHRETCGTDQIEVWQKTK